MREAVIVSTARTPIGKAYRGAFNNTQAQALGGHAIAEAVRRAHVDPAEVGDVIMGAALQQGSTSSNPARQAALRAGLPTSVAGMGVRCSFSPLEPRPQPPTRATPSTRPRLRERDMRSSSAAGPSSDCEVGHVRRVFARHL